MYFALFVDWLNEVRIYRPFPHNLTFVLYIDNWSARKFTADVQAVLELSHTEQLIFPECAADLVQPAETFFHSAFEIRVEVQIGHPNPDND